MNRIVETPLINPEVIEPERQQAPEKPALAADCKNRALLRGELNPPSIR